MSASICASNMFSFIGFFLCLVSVYTQAHAMIHSNMALARLVKEIEGRFTHVPVSGDSGRQVNAHVTTAEYRSLLRGCNYHRIYPLQAILYTLALTFSEHAGCLSCISFAQSMQVALQQFLHVFKANLFLVSRCISRCSRLAHAYQTA